MNDVRFSIEVFEKTFDKAVEKTIREYSKMLAEDTHDADDMIFGLMMGQHCALLLGMLKKNLFNSEEK